MRGQTGRQERVNERVHFLSTPCIFLRESRNVGRLKNMRNRRRDRSFNPFEGSRGQFT